MGYLGRRIGLSQDNGDSNPGAAGGAVGGGLLDLFAHGYFERQGDIYNAPGAAPAPMGASGGVISDYTDPGSGNVYRAHIFTSSGTFQVNTLASGSGVPNNIDFLVIGGGGAGGEGCGGGGGAGGYRTSMPDTPGGPGTSAESQVAGVVGSYAVTIGAGGGSSNALPDTVKGNSGSFSNIAFPSAIRSEGGGGGGFSGGSGSIGYPGGSAGGGNYPGRTLALANKEAGTSTSVPTQGHAGGTSASGPQYANGGGGGAGGAGGNTPDNDTGGAGGAGKASVISHGPTNPITRAGGGGGGVYAPNTAGAATGGGGAGSGENPAPGTNGTEGTGGGGGGSSRDGVSIGGAGGSGLVVVRYQIASIAATAKATGGAISFYNNKTIHAFTGSGTFATAPNWSSATVEYVVVGGGGAGGSWYQAGGGGAGAYRTGTTPIGAHPVSTTIQVGGGAQSNPTPAVAGTGTPSYFGTPITSPGGGSGGNYPTGAAVAGGSGGGSGGAGTSPNAGGLAPGATSFPGTIGATPPSSWWGHAGGTGGSLTAPAYGPAGGGGAGGVGSNGSPADTTAGRGGAGIQIPTSFRDPTSGVGAPGPTSAPTPNGFDTSGKYWVAGGGGGTGYNPPGTAVGVDGAPGGNSPAPPPHAGGGGGAGDNNGLGSSLGAPGTVNTGGGGGGGERTSPTPASGGLGGSGIVLIAYPS